MNLKIILILIFTTVSLILNPSTPKDQEDWQPLFNGKNLEGWETYLAKPDKSLDVEGLPRNADGTYKEPYGINNDPLGVFSVVTEDGKPAIRISGKVFGALTSKERWKNYHLQLQFKWGENQWPPRKNAKRDTGLLYYAFGAHGGADNSWMKSQEFQIQHTDVGDYWGVGGGAMDITARKTADNKSYIYDSGAPKISFGEGLEAGRHCKKAANYENPHGQWNTLDLYTYGNTAVHVVNGHPVMVLHNSRYIGDGQNHPLTGGRIQLQSEGAEVYYRHIKLQSIEKIPEKFLK